jgi:hypothetical protein
MKPLPELCPVVETPSYEGEPPWPWPASRREPFSHLPLNGDMAAEDVGLVFGYLVSYNDLRGDTIRAMERSLLDAGPLYLPGGLRIRCGSQEILPACCCGLEGWQDWKRFLATGISPWLGHDPFAWAVLADDAVRVWSDGAHKPAPDAFFIEFERLRFEAELLRVEENLKAFAVLVERWAKDVGFSAPDAARGKWEQHFLLDQ